MSSRTDSDEPETCVSLHRSGNHWYLVLRDGDSIRVLPLHAGEPDARTCVDCGCVLVEEDDDQP